VVAHAVAQLDADVAAVIGRTIRRLPLLIMPAAGSVSPVAKEPRSREMPSGAAMQEHVLAAISGLGSAEIKDVLQRLLAVPNALNSLLERPPPPLARTSSTNSPSATSRCASDRPAPRRPLHRRGWAAQECQRVLSLLLSTRDLTGQQARHGQEGPVHGLVLGVRAGPPGVKR